MLFALSRGQCLFETISEESAIGQTRQRVIIGKVVYFLFGFVALSYLRLQSLRRLKQVRGPLLNHLLELAFILPLSQAERAMVQCTPHRGFNVPEIEGLREVIESANAKRIDRGIDCQCPTHHDYDSVGIKGQYLRHHFEPADSRHSYIADNQVKLVGPENLKALLCRRGGLTVVFVTQRLAQNSSYVRLVVQDQNALGISR